jgi:FlaA1/EpsC-like NDP-sugar epimerase
MSQKLVRLVIRCLLALGLLVLLLLTTNPYHLPLVLLILPFVLIFAVIYEGMLAIGLSISGQSSKKRRQINALILSGGIITLALLQSIRQLSLRDLIIIILLIAGLAFYVRRIDL